MEPEVQQEQVLVEQMRQAGESVGKGHTAHTQAHPLLQCADIKMPCWVGCGINVVSIADIFFKECTNVFSLKNTKYVIYQACTMIAVNHHTLCQLILTETCNLSFGLIFCFFQVISLKLLVRNAALGTRHLHASTPPPPTLAMGSAPSSVSLLQLLLCFTQQEQP